MKGTRMLSDEQLKKDFIEYLEKHTKAKKSGKDYSSAINSICKDEDLTWIDLVYRIDEVLAQYDKGGKKENLGKKNNSQKINALRNFKNFIIYSNKNSKTNNDNIMNKIKYFLQKCLSKLMSFCKLINNCIQINTKG